MAGLWTPYTHLTDDELLGTARGSEDAIVRELADRMAGHPERIAALEAELDEEYAARAAESREADAALEDALEAARDAYEDRLAAKDETIAREMQRVDEFAEENEAYRAEIETLKATLTPLKAKKETPVTETTARLIELIEETNALLRRILAALHPGGGGTPGTAALAPPKTAPTADTTADVITLHDLREAFMAAQQAAGKDAAVKAVKAVAGDVANITRVSEGNYPAVVAALNTLAAGAAESEAA